MDRREFFKKAFAAGIVATVPYSIFTDHGSAVAQIEEEVHMRQLDFGDYKAILVHRETVIAKSHVVNIHMERDLIDVTSRGSEYPEFIPGKLSFDFTMQNVLEDTDVRTLRIVLERAELLTIYLQDVMGRKFEAGCYMVALEVTSGGEIYPEYRKDPITCGIRLQGSGALIQQDYGQEIEE